MFFYLTAVLFDDIKTFIPNIFAQNPLSNTTYAYGIIGIIAIAGASILGFHLLSLLHKNLKTKKESPTSIPRRNVIRPKKKTDDEKLLDLIYSLDLFIKKWRNSCVFKVSYRRDIEMQSMWENRGKIREHSRDIRNTIKPLRSLQSPNHKVILDSLESILNRMVDLGLEVESTFETTKTIKRDLESEPNKINRLISEEYNICRDLTNIVSQLEKLR